MKVKTSDLIGPALDWAVARVENLQVYTTESGIVRVLLNNLVKVWMPCEDWAQGGPIIDQLTRRGLRIHGMKCRYGTDETSVNVDVNGHYAMSGPNILIAAMRCYVASRLGDEVEIPKELL